MRKVLVADLSQLLAFVTAKANGDKPTLLSFGFTLGKEIAGTYELGDFDYLTLTHSKNSGDVLERYGKVDGAVSYLIDYKESSVLEYNWQSEPETYLKPAKRPHPP